MDALRTPGRPRMPSQAEMLARIDARLARIERFIDQAPPILATVADAADDLAERAQRDGTLLDDRIAAVTKLLDAVSRPDTATALTQLIERAESLAVLTKRLDDMPGLLATLGDTVDDVAGRLADEGIELDTIGKRLAQLIFQLAQVLQSPAVADLLSSGAIPAIIDGVSSESSARRLGMFGLWRATRDPDVQRALALSIELARGIGRATNGGNKALSANSRKELPSVETL